MLTDSFQNSSHFTHTCDPILSAVNEQKSCLSEVLCFSSMMSPEHSWPQTRCLRSIPYAGGWQVPNNLPVFLRDTAWSQEELANAGQPLLMGTFPWMVMSMVIYLLQIDIIFFSPLYLSTFCHLVPSAVHGKLSLYFRIQFCKLLSAWGLQIFTVLKAGQGPWF